MISPKESLGLRTWLEEKHQCQLAAGTSSQDAQKEALEGELPAEGSEEPGRGMFLSAPVAASLQGCSGL